MLHCHVATTQVLDPQSAAQEVIHAIRQEMGEDLCDLVCLFFSAHYAQSLRQLVEPIRHALVPRVFVGCMGTGVIGGGQEIEDAPGLVVWVLKGSGVELIPLHLMPVPDGDRMILSGWPNDTTRSWHEFTCLLFVDPYSTPLDDLLTLLQREVPNMPLVGGIAAGGMHEKTSRLLLQNEVVDSGAVGVAIGGGITVQLVVSQGCQPIGERYVVTAAEQNVIHEVGGRTPLKRLEEILTASADSVREKAAYGLQIGIAMNEHQASFGQGDFLIRGIVGADQTTGHLAIADRVREGQTVQFHIRDPIAAADDFRDQLAGAETDEPTCGKTPRGALLFDCCGRGSRFFQTPNHDVSLVRDSLGSVPLAGFFAGGELGPVAGKNFLHSYTATMAMFYEV